MRANPENRLYRFLLLIAATIVLPVAGATSRTVDTVEVVAPAPVSTANEAAPRAARNGVARTDLVRNDAGTVMLATLPTGSFPAYVLGAPTAANLGQSGAAFKAGRNDAISQGRTDGSDGTSPSYWDGVLSTLLLLAFFLIRRAR